MGRNELNWHQLTHNQLMSLERPHFSPHSTAKTNDKSTNLRKNGVNWYKRVSTSVYSEKTHLKKLMMIIMNKSQERTVFNWSQKCLPLRN